MGSRVIGRGKDKASKFSLSPNNVRTVLDETPFLDLKLSIKEFNEVLEPIIINTKNEVVAGGRRWKAAKELDMEVDWIMKEYDSPKDEILDSLAENTLHHEMDTEDKIRAAVKLKDEYGMSLREIAPKIGVSFETIRIWYNYAKGPKSIIPEEEKAKIEAEEKKKGRQTTLEEVHKEIKEKKEILEKKKKAKEIWDSISLRKASIVGRIIDSPHFTKDIGKILEFLEFARKAKLRILEDIYKDLNKGIEVNWEFRKEISENLDQYLMRTVRMPKILMEKIKPILKRRRIDFSEFIIEASLCWLRKWSIEENWEGELKKQLPKALSLNETKVSNV